LLIDRSDHSNAGREGPKGLAKQLGGFDSNVEHGRCPPAVQLDELKLHGILRGG